MSSHRPAVLTVDDDEGFRRQVTWMLGDRFLVRTAADLDAALAELGRQEFAVVLLDLHLQPDGKDLDGLEILRWIARHAPDSRVVLLTGESDPEIARETLRWGAWDFYPKPVDPDELRSIVSHAARLRDLEESEPAEPPGAERLGGMASVHPEMIRVLRAARALAATALPVLIVGPAQCGKTRLAREIVRAWDPQGRPPRVIAAGTLPDPRAEDADGAWILEQVESLPPRLQERLQSLLVEPEARGAQFRPYLIATARADLLEAARRNRFRPDLARHLETARLEIPPLSLRPEDLPLLCGRILSEWSEEKGRLAPRLAPDAFAALSNQIGRCEVGGLAEILRAAAERTSGRWISADVVPPDRPVPASSLKDQRSRLEADLLQETLARRGGNVSQAARDLGVSRPTLHDLMRKHALDPARFRRR